MAGTTAALKHGINEMNTFLEKVAKTQMGVTDASREWLGLPNSHEEESIKQ